MASRIFHASLIAIMAGNSLAQSDQERSTAFDAAARGHADIVAQFLAKFPDPNLRNACGETLLHLASANGRVEVVKLLLASKADPNARSPGATCTKPSTAPGDTPLHAAVRNRYPEVVRALIAAHADVRIPSFRWVTPLSLAVMQNDPTLVDELLSNGADVYMPDRDGRTPLAHAAAAGNPEIAAKLVAAHADVNAPDLQGVTPLMLAARKPSLEVVRLLLNDGADPFVTDNAGNLTALYGIDGGDPAVAGAILDGLKSAPAAYRVTLVIALLKAASNGKTPLLKELLNRGAAPDGATQCKRTALISAAGRGDLEAVKLLLGKGANPSASESIDGTTPCLGNTPLIEAAFNRQLSVVKTLLDANAAVGRRNAAGWNALDALRASAPQPDAETQRLIDRMHKLLKEQPPIYGPNETPVYRSKALLWAVTTLAAPHPGETADVAAVRAGIAKTSTDLIARWPANTWSAYGITVSGSKDYPRPFQFNAYDKSLSLDLMLMDYAERDNAGALLPIVSEDLQAKLADCIATGPSGGPEEKVSFVYKTIKPPNESAPGYRLRYADRKMVGLSMVRHAPIEFVSSPHPSESAVQLQPGTYWMFIMDEATQAKSACEKVEVGKHVELSRSFSVAALSKGNECQAIR